jgi:hypothetical protein
LLSDRVDEAQDSIENDLCNELIKIVGALGFEPESFDSESSQMCCMLHMARAAADKLEEANIACKRMAQPFRAERQHQFFITYSNKEARLIEMKNPNEALKKIARTIGSDGVNKMAELKTISEKGISKANPAELRKAMTAAQEMAMAGIDFVCVPVLSEGHKNELIEYMQGVLRIMIHESEKTE